MPRDEQEIKEYIAHSWYTYDGGNDVGVHPWAGETKINYAGPKPPFETLEGFDKYSFLKTPRWKDNPMEVGPLARLLVSYAAGHADVKEAVGAALGKLNVPVAALFSTLGRTAARGIDAALAMIWLKEFYGQLMDRVKINEVSTFNGEKWDPKTWPADAKAWVWWKLRAARWRTGSRSTTARSTTTSWSCPPRGTARRATPSSSTPRLRRR